MARRALVRSAAASVGPGLLMAALACASSPSDGFEPRGESDAGGDAPADGGGTDDAASDAALDGAVDAGATDTGLLDAGSSCLGPGDYEDVLTLDGVAHEFRLHVPEGRADPASLILLLHGGASTGAAMDAVAGLTDLAVTEGFVVLIPEGWSVTPRAPQVWNGGACCGRTGLAPDHVAALSAIVDRAVALDGCIDPKRIFATGHSNGGIMSYRLACERGDRFAAVAVSAGSLGNEDLTTTPPTPIFECDPPRPVSVLHVHGLEDLCVPYEGGRSDATGNTLPAVEDVIATWRRIDGCGAGTDTATRGVRRRTWACDQGSAVELITVEGLGHAWAGSPIYGSPVLCGGTTTDLVSTTAELWRFFQAHPMPARADGNGS